MKRELIKHEESENSTYGFNLLNDKQIASITGEFDFLHCSINEDLKGGKVLLRCGESVDFELTMTGVKIDK